VTLSQPELAPQPPLPVRPTLATMLPHAHIRLPLGKLTAWLLIGAALVSLAAAGIAGGLSGSADWLSAGLLAAGSVAAGTLLGVLFLGLFGPRSAVMWAMVIVAGSTLRMAAGLGAAMILYFAQRPDKAAFWSAFLAACLVLLALEVIVLRPALLAGNTPESPRT
jgi:hypothetical protein